MMAMALRASIVLIALWASPARAGDVAVSGHVGYLSEWEITATAHAMTNGGRKEFAGPLTMKHIGACAADGAVEKSGEIRFWRTGLLTSRIEGVLTLAGEQCAFETREATHEGIMKCPLKGGVPLSLKVE